MGLLSAGFSPPYRGFEEPVTIQIEPGTSSRELAVALEEAGVIRSRWLFLAVRGMRPRTVLMAGEYRFWRRMTVWQVFDKISLGQVEYHRLTIPEGLTRFETADLIAAAGLFSREEFLAEAEQAHQIQGRFRDAVNLEGFLYPETYHFTLGITAREFVRMMIDQFYRVFEEVTRENSVSLTPYEIVTLASLIEKETGAGGERRLVSSVFHHRLTKNIRLQCDPTVVYGLILENRFRGTIYRSDLKDKHPYNTYVHAGLPPGPIANPGRASLEAAVKPAESDYLFFVAEPFGTGKHVFSETLQAHDRAVVAYREARSRR
jgi:UPF0755 protein